MIQKWKTILTNWMNCYSDETEKRQQNITHESLLTVFAHINENLKLDNSESSKLEPHAIQDFIVEKYPEFKFENGTLEAGSEEDIYIVASLLLFFTCVNSKNDDIKRVMCSKLDVGDQEIILKFSKCLMECSPVLYADVEAAITEACGDDAARQVAETPPALRSLHGEARRLQAALDAERFDRNYLQEELARTNLKLEKLTKDKEQFKLEILNLKAKISLCCGEQRESRSQTHADDSRLQRQLQELETQLENTQSHLEDIQNERDIYKRKVDELKQERDKWLSLSQEEAARAGQLTDQLETERRTVQSLKDLVSELRQHNRNNALDASLLECDDPDASIHSLNNVSVCSEACANVVEVQLGEERAKIEVLKQQIQILQDQLSEVGQRFESQKLSLETIISEKENNIFGLKHRVNEEIEDKNNLRAHYQQEVDKLNNKIAELAQKIEDNEEQSRVALQEKIQEIESLQQKFAEDGKKSDNIIKNLKIELDAEKFAQLKLRDEFDNRLMKLNEKVLNRNNELVELQNNIIMKSEMIELIQSDLRKEKELRDELSNNCNTQLQKLNEQRIAIENDIQQKYEDILKCQAQLQEKDICIEKLNKELKNLQSTVSNLEENCQHQDSKIIEKQKEIELINDLFQKEQEKISHKLDERNATVKSLQMQLQNEIEFKIQLQNQIAELESSKSSLIEVVNDVKKKSKADLLEKENMVDAIDMCLKQEKESYEELKKLCEEREYALKEKAEETSKMKMKIKLLEDQLETEAKLFKEELIKRDEIIESTNSTCNNQLLISNDQIIAFEHKMQQKLDEIEKCYEQLQEKEKCIEKLNKELENLHISALNLKDKCQLLDSKIIEKQEEIEFVNDMFQKENEKLAHKVDECNATIELLQIQLQNEIELKTQLQNQVSELEKERKNTNECLEEVCKTKDEELKELLKDLSEKKTKITLLENEFEAETKLFKEELEKRDNIIQSTNSKLTLVLKEKTDLQETLKNLNDERAKLVAVALDKDKEHQKLKNIYEKLCRGCHENKIQKNDLVELQKNITMKNELIELIQADLTKERESKVELSNTLQNQLLKLNEQIIAMKNVQQQNYEEITKYQEQLQEKEMCIENLNREVGNLLSTVSKLEEKCLSQDVTIIEKQKEIEFFKDMLHKEQNKLALKVDEHNANVKSLEMQLQKEIEFKVQLQNQITELEACKMSLMEAVNNIENKSKAELLEKDNMLDAIDMCLRQAKKSNNDLRELYEKNNSELKERIEEIFKMEIKTKLLSEQYQTETKLLKDELDKKDDVIRSTSDKLSLLLEKCELQEESLNNLNDEKANLLAAALEKDNEYVKLKTEYEQLCRDQEEIKSLNIKLVELQNCITAKNDMIERIQSDLKNEKRLRDELSDTCNSQLLKLNEQLATLKNVIQQKCEEIEQCHLLLQDKEINTEKLKKELENLQITISNLDHKVIEKQKEIEFVNDGLQKERENLIHEVEGHNATIKSLEMQLQKEIESKSQLQNQVVELEATKMSLMKAVADIKSKSEADLLQKENMLDAIDICLKQEKKANVDLKEICEKRDQQLKELFEEVFKKENKILILEDQIETESKFFKEELKKRDEIINLNDNKLSSILQEKTDLEKSLDLLNNEKTKLLTTITEKDDDYSRLKTVYEKLCQDREEKQIMCELNRNKELVELRNSIIMKNEMIERIQSDLRKEKELKDELRNISSHQILTLNQQKVAIENDLQRKCEEIIIYQEQLQEKGLCIEKLHKEVDNLQSTVSNLEEKCQKEDDRFKEKQKEIELINDLLQKEQENLALKVDEHKSTVKSLKMQLQNEVALKAKLESQVAQLEISLKEAVNDIKDKSKADLLEKENVLDVIDKCLKEEKKSNEDLKEVCDRKDQQIKELLEEVSKKETKMKLIEDQFKTEAKLLKEDLVKRDDIIESTNKKLSLILQEKIDLQESLNILNDEKAKLLAEAIEKDNDNLKLKTAYEKLCNDHNENTESLKSLKAKLNDEVKRNEELQDINEKNTTRLLSKLEETEQSIKKIHKQSKSVIDSKELQIQTLMMEVATLQKTIESERETLSLIKKERDALEQNISKEVFFQNSLEEEYQKKCKVFEHKNEEIAELKRQVMKMSVTENRASQIIKVSAKYQAMILKRIAEIKSTAVLKELTNFGNSNTNGDSELRRSLTAGSVTLEDLENFLETTDRHLKRCSEKQIALQKDRDRLSEVNRINESEIINMNKFLTELSVSFRTFTTVKDVYSQKLSKIVSLQRTVRRDILSLDGHITEATMCKLERGYAAVMQDLSECAMNLERWVERSISRMMSPERIKQAFTSDHEQTSLSSVNYQNGSIEMQLSELENSFQKLLGEIGRAQRGEGARSAQEVTIMEVRAEYEDKLNRMKAKMKELFHEEMGRLKQKQSEEIAILERELIKSREKMADSSRKYEEHIRALTTELWSVGEKFLVKQEEADWLRKKQSGSLISLQHIHSTGLQPQHEVINRPSDTLSLRSLPTHNKKTEGRGLHMSDEEGEVFDNRFLKELSTTPRASLAPGQRISELKRRNSLVPPHLKSSYPAELQFAPILDEEDIKCAGRTSVSGRQQRKEVGITAYKKPGPPTPSKQAGRLSATDSELRESLRVEADPLAGRKTSTPSRIRSLFRSHRNDVDEGTPRSRRFSSIFRKK